MHILTIVTVFSSIRARIFWYASLFSCISYFSLKHAWSISMFYASGLWYSFKRWFVWFSISKKSDVAASYNISRYIFTLFVFNPLLQVELRTLIKSLLQITIWLNNETFDLGFSLLSEDQLC